MTIQYTFQYATMAALLTLVGGAYAADQGAQAPLDSFTKQGVVIDFLVQNEQAQPLRQGDAARVMFHAHDSSSAAPIRGAYPAAWMHPRPATVEGESGPNCRALTQQFIGSSLFTQAQVDLNIYHVLAMNDDASIAVVDPLFGFGGSKLLHMQTLRSPAYDWVKNAAQTSVYMTLPESNTLARLDTKTWALDELRHPQLGHPGKIVLQDDQKFLWVSTATGVAIVNSQTFSWGKAFDLGGQPSDIIISQDGHFVYLLTTVGEQNPSTLHVIDMKNQRLVRHLKLPGRAAAMAYSDKADMVYVSDAEQGKVYGFEGSSQRQVATIDSQTGAGLLRFDPSGRWGFLLNPVRNTVSIIDAAQNRIVQSATVEQHPEHVVFSNELAYIRHAGSDTLLMIPLDERSLGEEGARIRAVDTPGGDHAPGLNPQPTAAAGIVQAPGANAVLIANYHDQAIYFYKEGMAAPMGQFNNYGRSPRAVMTIDKSLREQDQPGVYETTFRVPAPGVYDVVYFMDTPRINHCFTLTVPGATTSNSDHTAQLRELHGEQILTAGQPAQLQFEWLSQQPARQPKGDTIAIEIALESGQWRQNQTVTPSAQGILAMTFTPPARGVYQVNIAQQQFHYLVK